jgi:hypothetical protein
MNDTKYSLLVLMTQNAWGGAPLWSDRQRRLACVLVQVGLRIERGGESGRERREVP